MTLPSLKAAEAESNPRLHSPKRPCAECPWREDVAPGHFPAERFVALAQCAEDMSTMLFQCHVTSDDRPLICAGFALQGAAHNLAMRLAVARGDYCGDPDAAGFPLFADYAQMAMANGVASDDPCLARIRLDTARPRRG